MPETVNKLLIPVIAAGGVAAFPDWRFNTLLCQQIYRFGYQGIEQKCIGKGGHGCHLLGYSRNPHNRITDLHMRIQHQVGDITQILSGRVARGVICRCLPGVGNRRYCYHRHPALFRFKGNINDRGINTIRIDKHHHFPGLHRVVIHDNAAESRQTLNGH